MLCGSLKINAFWCFAIRLWRSGTYILRPKWRHDYIIKGAKVTYKFTRTS